jgi:hypothetical protein
MRLATQQEPEKVKVMARRSSDRSGLFSAEVPNGPFRTCQVPTEAVAVPLHSLHVAPDKPTVVAPNARKQAGLIPRCSPDSQGYLNHSMMLLGSWTEPAIYCRRDRCHSVVECREDEPISLTVRGGPVQHEAGVWETVV